VSNQDQITNRPASVRIVHNIHSPIGARSFIMHIVAYLNRVGIDSQLWVENRPQQADTIAELKGPKQFIDSDLVKNPIALLKRVLAYRQLLIATKPEVLHTHQTRGSIVPLLAAYWVGVPIRIYHNHGLPYLGYRGPLRWFLRGLEQLNILLATHVLLVSHSNLAAARADRLLPAHKGETLASGSAAGVDLDKFPIERYQGIAAQQARVNLNLPADAFVLGYVGRPVKRKGFNFLLQTWEKSGLAEDGRHFLIIAGCTQSECDRVYGRSIPGVRGLGFLHDLNDFYAASDVITLPSDHEGFPYSLLEGAAAGKPLLGTNIPGISCAIQDRVTGLLIPVNDESKAIAAIRELADSPELRTQLGKNARERVEREFTTEIVLGSLLDFYIDELKL
jgi:N,N'-diacetylbacillosaminyl-diphospho-undecaprenol alpha-1,3-N-acetylgalactosaminyltransferase